MGKTPAESKKQQKKDEQSGDEEVDLPPTVTQIEVCRSFSGFKITPFDGNNFRSWKMRIMAVLEEHDLGDIIIRPHENVERKREKRCRALIKVHLADNILSLMDGKTVIEIWKSLCSTYERSGTQLRVHRWHTLCSLKFNEKKESLSLFITRFEICIQQLKSTGVKLEEVDIVSLFLYTLGSCYNSVVDALQTLSENRMTMELVKNRLLDFDLKRTEKAKNETVNDDMSARAFVAKSSDYGEPSLKCDKCGRTNHQTSDCRQNNYHCYRCNQMCHICADCRVKFPDGYGESQGQGQRNNNNAVNSSNNNASNGGLGGKSSGEMANHVEDGLGKTRTVSFFAAVAENESSDWVLDMSVKRHIVNNRCLFYKSKKLKNKVRVQVPNTGQFMCATEVGNIRVKSKMNNRFVEYELENVLFIPELNQNLVPASLMAEAGRKVVLEGARCLIFFGNRVIMCGDATSGIYLLDLIIDNYKDVSFVSDEYAD